jgi:pimeloyl-ACP methyl ester carboxylesterase
LLIRGANTEVLLPEFAQRMRDAIPNCRVVEVPNAGHGVPADNPEGFEAAIREFLKNQTVP